MNKDEKWKAGVIWDNMSKEERATIYKKVISNPYNGIYDPICIINMVNTNWYRMGGNKTSFAKVILKEYSIKRDISL